MSLLMAPSCKAALALSSCSQVWGSGITSYTFYIILHRTSVITDRGASRSPCMLCDQESSYPSIKDTAKAVEQEHWQTQSLALCPSSCSVLGPGSLSRAAALWEESGVMLCISVWGFSGIVGWVSVARIWSGKAAGAASVSSSCPHVGQSPFQTAPKTAPLLPKLCPSAPCSWLGKRPWGGQWGLGQLGMWTKGFSPLHADQKVQNCLVQLHRYLGFMLKIKAFFLFP